MGTTASVAATGTLTVILVLSSSAAAAKLQAQRATDVGRTSNLQPSAGHVRLLKAFVIDDRLSALRREPSLQSVVIRRIRLAQPVYLVSTPHTKAREQKFIRVAVTRRTRGWILASALAVPGRAAEDLRIMALVENSNDPIDRITLCRIIIEGFGRSRSVPRAMLFLAGEAERVATTLSQRTRRRLADLRGSEASLRDYYLSDAGLDRYSRLGIVFDFNESSGEFSYDGKAYRELVRRFPGAEESKLARQRLDHASRNRSQTP
jgi:hypothetical protein